MTQECKKALDKRSAPYVVKADGLAAGKGAFLPNTREEAMTICSMMLEDMILGSAGRNIIIETTLKDRK